LCDLHFLRASHHLVHLPACPHVLCYRFCCSFSRALVCLCVGVGVGSLPHSLLRRSPAFSHIRRSMSASSGECVYCAGVSDFHRACRRPHSLPSVLSSFRSSNSEMYSYSLPSQSPQSTPPHLVSRNVLATLSACADINLHTVLVCIHYSSMNCRYTRKLYL
jgi:hypothetical protein